MALPNYVEVIIGCNETMIAELEESNNAEMHGEDMRKPEPIPTLANTPDEMAIFNDECVICCELLSSKEDKDQKSTIVFPCKHALCYECTLTYFTTLLYNKTDITCPICRTLLVQSESPVYKATYSQYIGVEINSAETMTPTTMSQQDRDTIITNAQENVRRTRRERWFMVCPCLFIVFFVIALLIVWSCS
jgi:hypothetical protein